MVNKSSKVKEKIIQRGKAPITKEYICTTNTWAEVESLGNTVHRETDSIYYETHRACSPSEAKAKFIFNQAVLCKFTDVRCRLSKNVRL